MENKFLLVQTDSALDLPIPEYQTEGSSGMDLYANVESRVVINTGEILLISTGIKVSIPVGYEIQLRPRSGLAINHGITLLNSPGTVDSDYRGEIKVILINHGDKAYTINRGDKICQMVIAEVVQLRFEVVTALDETKRGNGGFGHTGK
jgi:dUTP pyrophosphatase